ncbi:MAG: CDP-diacylglycerol--serine O-phosphatidyltransferase [Verrucomicrobiae bacterium]|nr:CDP-diacylglycerol--serine O-phosphatidyltransferase [Verrucomicrobiae bacterium]
MTEQPPPGNVGVKIYLLPNLMTAMNLLCGFAAILTILKASVFFETHGETNVALYHQALLLIIGACVFDMLDGRVARMGGLESPFGIQFDSLADVVSFGLAPALLMVKFVLADFHPAGAIIAGIYLTCGALRLARFNCIAMLGDKNAGKDFMGFPIPAAAGVTASITLLLLWLDEGNKEIGRWKYALPPLMLFLSFMMFSKFKYPSFKSIGWKTHVSPSRILLIVLFIVMVVMYYQFMLAVVFIGYLLYGFLRPLISVQWRREIEEDEAEDSPPHP